jgi:hypothetical protein
VTAGERGQASVEAVAATAVLLLVGAIALQLLAVGYAGSLAGGAAEAGALALAAGRDPQAAARAAAPGWSRGRMAVGVRGGRVRVALRPPAALPWLGRTLEVEASAAVVLPGRR